jgi:hypothetical protein
MKRFSFVLLVDDEEKYEIVDCHPPIDDTELTTIARELNNTEDMSLLVRHMRKCTNGWCRGMKTGLPGILGRFFVSVVEVNEFF